MKRLLAACCLVVIQLPAFGGPLVLPDTPRPEFVQTPGVRLPLALGFVDDGGASVTLGSYFGERPVLLLLGYYQCRNLCSTVAEGMLDAISRTGLPRNAYRLVEVSIDPRETPSLAARKRISYAPAFGRQGVDMHLLTGEASAIAQLAQAVGFHFVYDRQLRQYIHPAGFIVATPDGRVSRYFLGVQFEPAELRAALQKASGDDIGSPAERLLLLCSHYDPTTGRYSADIMMLARGLCIAVVAALGTWMWRRHRLKDERQQEGRK
jgi:protein SCO1/2